MGLSDAVRPGNVRQRWRNAIASARPSSPVTTRRGKTWPVWQPFDRAQLATVIDMLAMQESISAVARATGLSRQAVHRIVADPAGAEASLARWGL